MSHNVNDQFIFYGIDPVGGGGAAAPEHASSSTPEAGTVNFTGLAALAAGMGAALGSSSEPFSNYVTCGTNLLARHEARAHRQPSERGGWSLPRSSVERLRPSAGFHDAALAGLGFTLWSERLRRGDWRGSRGHGWAAFSTSTL